MTIKELRDFIFENKNEKLVRRPKIINKQPESLENTNIVVIKSATIEHPKTFFKLSKTTRRSKNIPQVNGADKNSKIYSETTKAKKYFDEKKDFKKCKSNKTISCL